MITLISSKKLGGYKILTHSVTIVSWQQIKTLPLESFSEYVSRDESIMSDLMSKRNTGISSSQNSTLRSATGCNGSNTIPLSALTDVNFTPTRQVSFLTASLYPAVLCIGKLLRSWPMLLLQSHYSVD